MQGLFIYKNHFLKFISVDLETSSCSSQIEAVWAANCSTNIS